MEKRGNVETKYDNTSAMKHTSRIRSAIVSSSNPTKLENFESFEEIFDLGSRGMTKNSWESCRSEPISIPNSKVSSIALSEDLMSLSESPPSSVGDSVYNSPKPPRSSKDFDDVMVKFKRHNNVQRVRSFDDVTIEDCDGETRVSHFPLSSSLPPQSVTRRKGRRTVHFDEATITKTAELGESAARFRSLWRKKRGLTTLPCPRFGESRNIAIQHEEEETPSPQLDRKDNKSIFDVCNYSSYGRYT